MSRAWLGTVTLTQPSANTRGLYKLQQIIASEEFSLWSPNPSELNVYGEKIFGKKGTFLELKDQKL